MKANVLRIASLGLVMVVLGVFALGLVLVDRGERAMVRSDAAFHGGNLTDAIIEAKGAGLSYVPGAEHVQRAERRLEAIARGAETEGKLGLARMAWDALRVIDEQTTYPGRGALASGERARRALERIDGREADEPEPKSVAPKRRIGVDQREFGQDDGAGLH